MKFLWLLSLVLISAPILVNAEWEFVPLVGVPGLNNAEGYTLQGYIDALYILAISVAAFMAVVKLIYAGVQYILSDVITSKENAKKDIKNSIIGLLVVLGATLLLNTINPQLTNLSALEEIKPSETTLRAHSVTTDQELANLACQKGQRLVKSAEHPDGECQVVRDPIVESDGTKSCSSGMTLVGDNCIWSRGIKVIPSEYINDLESELAEGDYSEGEEKNLRSYKYQTYCQNSSETTGGNVSYGLNYITYFGEGGEEIHACAPGG